MGLYGTSTNIQVVCKLIRYILHQVIGLFSKINAASQLYIKVIFSIQEVPSSKIPTILLSY